APDVTGLKLKVLGNSSIEARWNMPEVPVSWYEIVTCPVVPGHPCVDATAEDKSSYVIENLMPGTEYEVKVQSVIKKRNFISYGVPAKARATTDYWVPSVTNLALSCPADGVIVAEWTLEHPSSVDTIVIIACPPNKYDCRKATVGPQDKSVEIKGLLADEVYTVNVTTFLTVGNTTHHGESMFGNITTRPKQYMKLSEDTLNYRRLHSTALVCVTERAYRSKTFFLAVGTAHVPETHMHRASCAASSVVSGCKRVNRLLKTLSHTCDRLRPATTRPVFKPLMTAARPPRSRVRNRVGPRDNTGLSLLRWRRTGCVASEQVARRLMRLKTGLVSLGPTRLQVCGRRFSRKSVNWPESVFPSQIFALPRVSVLPSKQNSIDRSARRRPCPPPSRPRTFSGSFCRTLQSSWDCNIHSPGYRYILCPIQEWAVFQIQVFEIRISNTLCILHLYLITNWVMYLTRVQSCSFFISTSTTMLHEYPGVTRVFLRYNTNLCSSAPVERLFSLGSLILCPNRRRLLFNVALASITLNKCYCQSDAVRLFFPPLTARHSHRHCIYYFALFIRQGSRPVPPRPHVEDVKDHSVLLTWETPKDKNHTIVGYEVTVNPGGKNISTNSTNVTLTDLEAWTQYSVLVASCTNITKCGTPKAATFRTNVDAPSAPQNLTVHSFGTHWVDVMWKAPQHPNGPLSGYNVTLKNGSELVWATTRNTSHNITGLEPGTSYEISVYAYNKAEKGEKKGPVASFSAQTQSEASGGGGVSGGTIAAAVLIPLLIIALVVGFFAYRKYGRKRGESQSLLSGEGS
ncbi:unnamed protein product, partial [Ixodes pacificus]